MNKLTNLLFVIIAIMIFTYCSQAQQQEVVGRLIAEPKTMTKLVEPTTNNIDLFDYLEQQQQKEARGQRVAEQLKTTTDPYALGRIMGQSSGRIEGKFSTIDDEPFQGGIDLFDYLEQQQQQNVEPLQGGIDFFDYLEQQQQQNVESDKFNPDNSWSEVSEPAQDSSIIDVWEAEDRRKQAEKRIAEQQKTTSPYLEHQQKPKNKYYISLGKSAKAFHVTRECYGLRNSKKVISVSREEAVKKYHRRPCKWCFR